MLLRTRILSSALIMLFVFIYSSFASATGWSIVSVDDITVVIPPQWPSKPGVDEAVAVPMCSSLATTKQWAHFFCNVMTKTQYNDYKLRTGKTYYYPLGYFGPGWIPVYNGSGLLQYLKYSSTDEIRYTPWSDLIANYNPYYLDWTIGSGGGTISRARILGFNSPILDADSNDPTSAFEPESYTFLAPLAEAYKLAQNPSWAKQYGDGLQTQAAASLFGTPGREFDGRVFVVIPTNESAFSYQFIELQTLSAASEYAAYYGSIFVNGSGNSFTEALANARVVAVIENRPTLLMYRWQDINYYRSLDATPFWANFQGLINESMRISNSNNERMTVVCHSNAVHLCARATSPFANVDFIGVNGAHAPIYQSEFLNALANFRGNVNLTCGRSDYWVSQTFYGCAGRWPEPWESTPSNHGNPTTLQVIDTKPNIWGGGIRNSGHTFIDMFDDDSDAARYIPIQSRPYDINHRVFEPIQ